MKGKLLYILLLFPAFTGLNLGCLAIGNLLFKQRLSAGFIVIGRYCETNETVFHPYLLTVVICKILFVVLAIALFNRYKIAELSRFLSAVLVMSFYGCMQEAARIFGLDKTGMNYFFSDKEMYSLSSYFLGGCTFILPLLYVAAGLREYYYVRSHSTVKQSFAVSHILLPLLSTALWVILLHFR